jgi:hypothetical protein
MFTRFKQLGSILQSFGGWSAWSCSNGYPSGILDVVENDRELPVRSLHKHHTFSTTDFNVSMKARLRYFDRPELSLCMFESCMQSV